MAPRRVTCAQTVTLILCVVFSIFRCSFGWGTAPSGRGEGRHIQPKCPRASVRYSRKLESCSLSWRLSAESSQEGQEMSQPPAVGPTIGDFDTEMEVASFLPNQPWWEPERRTEGKPTLTSSTQWRMFLSLKDPTLGGDTGETTEVAVRVRFNEDRNFEPPQGSLEVIEDNPYFTQQAGKARWTLSEEEEKRGAGLWVWGLFADPLYPFLLLQINNLEISLKGGAKIAPGKMYVKVDHRRDDDLGPTLNSGTVGVKLVERVRVDPLGMAEADIESVVPCGTVRFRPV